MITFYYQIVYFGDVIFHSLNNKIMKVRFNSILTLILKKYTNLYWISHSSLCMLCQFSSDTYSPKPVWRPVDSYTPEKHICNHRRQDS